MTEIDDIYAAALEDHEAGRLRDARLRLEAVLEIDPGHGAALHRLGLVAFQEGDGDAALGLLRRAAEAAAPDPHAFGNLGAVLLRRGDCTAAAEALARAVTVAPDNAENHYNLGLARGGLGEADAAEASYRRAIELAPRHAAAHNNLGNLLARAGRAGEAGACFRAAISADPEFAPAHRNLGDLLEAEGDVTGAQRAYRGALRVRPDGGTRIRLATVLPVVAHSTQQIVDARAAMEAELERLSDDMLSVVDPLRQVGGTAFLTSYHGLSNRRLHERLAAVHAAACPSLRQVAAHCEDWRGPAEDRIHVAFVSAFLRDHTIGRLNMGLIRRLPRDRFRVSLFACSGAEDAVTAELRARVDRYEVLPETLADARAAIARARPDVVYYTDIGMEPMSYFLGFARLAPVQCVTWGHPDTTGLSNIDYFISSALTEPEGAGAEYSESLIALPCFSTAVARPAIAASSRAALGVAEGAKLFLCPQSLFKFHPDFDDMIKRILADDPRSELLVIHGNRRAWSTALRARWHRTMPKEAERIRFLPRVSAEQFLRLLGGADVVLDTPHFCGGMTTYQALAAGTPVVTLPGAFMRGRLSLGLMREMELERTVAESPDAYVAMALALVNDRAYAEDTRGRIAENVDRLFGSTLAVAEHARFFEWAVGRAMGTEKRPFP